MRRFVMPCERVRGHASVCKDVQAMQERVSTCEGVEESARLCKTVQGLAVAC